MRILHVIPAVSKVYGGPSHAIVYMTAALVRRGDDVDVATTNADGASNLDVPTAVPVEREGVRTFHFPRIGRGSYRFSAPLTAWLFEHVASYDAVHLHGAFTYSTVAGALAARRADVPFIVRPLGNLDRWSLGQKRWKKAPYYALVERPNLTAASAIHATSAVEAEGIAALGFAHKTVTIPIGIPVPTASPRSRREGRTLRLLFLSRIHPKKGIPILLAAVAKARAAGVDLELTIAGNSEDGYERVVDQLVVDHGLGAFVRRRGFVEGPEKEALYAAADLFVLPSYQENFGIAVAEAMGRGLPVAVTDGVALASEVREVDAGFVVNVDDVAGLARGFARLAHDDTRLAAGERARALVLERFSTDACARDLQSLYRRIRRR
ncbi:MAG: glycosyltransferase [Polyangiales bacterium]